MVAKRGEESLRAHPPPREVTYSPKYRSKEVKILKIDEKCTSKKGNTLYGTAALLHRICGNNEIEEDAFDEEAYKKELYELLIECGYTTREDLYPEEYVEEYVPSRRSRETK